MDATAMVIGIYNICMAMVMILISLPMLKRKIPMNRWYGARFKKSFESEENWYQINAYSAKQSIVWSIPLLIIGIVTLFLPLQGNTGLAIPFACAPMLIFVPCFTSYRYAQKR